MSNTFEIGDVVRLKSGGPDMTVTYVGVDVEGNQRVDLGWFVEDQVRTATFLVNALERKTAVER